MGFRRPRAGDGRRYESAGCLAAVRHVFEIHGTPSRRTTRIWRCARVSRTRAGFIGRQLFLRGGTGVGFGPPLIRAAAQQYGGFRSPDWLEMILNAVLLLVPASFAYAVFKQRVLDVPVRSEERRVGKERR